MCLCVEGPPNGKNRAQFYKKLKQVIKSYFEIFYYKETKAIDKISHISEFILEVLLQNLSLSRE